MLAVTEDILCGRSGLDKHVVRNKSNVDVIYEQRFKGLEVRGQYEKHENSEWVIDLPPGPHSVCSQYY